MNISLKCNCGSFEGLISEISHSLNRRFVCLCNDCQAYAHFLGRVDTVLDPNGGTEILSVHPAKIKITQGVENLTCVRLSDDGMIRWYTRCCKTPIANTQTSPRFPYVGLVHTIMNFSGNSNEKEQKLGPIYARVNGKYGIGPLPPHTSQNTPLKLIFWTLLFLVRGFIWKLYTPSPFFDSNTGKPRVTPSVLSDSEYESLIQLCGSKTS